MSVMTDFPTDGAGSPNGCAEDPLAARWDAMHAAADAIAKMIGQENSAANRTRTLYPVAASDGDITDLITATEDLCAIMEQGLFAILRARENGAEAKIAGKTLLRKFETERRALLAEGEMESDLAA